MRKTSYENYRSAHSHPPCVDVTVGDDIASDVKVAPLASDSLCEPHYACLGRGIVGLTSTAVGPRHRRNVDDGAGARSSSFLDFFLGGIAHVGRGGLDKAERGSAVDVQHCLPLLGCHALDHAIPGEPRIVHQDVQTPKIGDCSVDNAFWKVLGAHVPRDGDSHSTRIADEIGCCLCLFAVQIRNDHVRPVLGKQQGCRLS